jgi:hypothetical protein
MRGGSEAYERLASVARSGMKDGMVSSFTITKQIPGNTRISLPTRNTQQHFSNFALCLQRSFRPFANRDSYIVRNQT